MDALCVVSKIPLSRIGSVGDGVGRYDGIKVGPAVFGEIEGIDEGELIQRKDGSYLTYEIDIDNDHHLIFYCLAL